MKTYMLDTCACIDLLRGNLPPPNFSQLRCAISSVVEAELWAGVYHQGGKKEQKKLELLLEAVDVVSFDSSAAKKTGEVLGILSNKGQKIGDFDAQIAGHALATGSVLLTDNVKHFKRIDGLAFLPWREE